jgi:peptide/nickel transport system permease protein
VSLVLSLPTVGPLLLKALVAQDMFLAGTIVLLLGVLTVVGTFLSDLLLMWIDPRIRMEGKR